MSGTVSSCWKSLLLWYFGDYSEIFCLISPQVQGYQRSEPCSLALKCLITCLSLIYLPSTWASSVPWQLAALFSWAKWLEGSQHISIQSLAFPYNCMFSTFLWCLSLIIRVHLCISLPWWGLTWATSAALYKPIRRWNHCTIIQKLWRVYSFYPFLISQTFCFANLSSQSCTYQHRSNDCVNIHTDKLTETYRKIP